MATPKTVLPLIVPKLERSLPKILGRKAGYCSMMDLQDDVWERKNERRHREVKVDSPPPRDLDRVCL